MRTINTMRKERDKNHRKWEKDRFADENAKGRLELWRVAKMRCYTKRTKYRQWTPLQFIVGNKFGQNPLRTSRDKGTPVLKSPSKKWLELKKYIKYDQLPIGFNIAGLNAQIAKIEANPRHNLHSTSHDWRECWNAKGNRSVTMNPLVAPATNYQFKMSWMKYDYWDDGDDE